jgi:hypothetical protein
MPPHLAITNSRYAHRATAVTKHITAETATLAKRIKAAVRVTPRNVPFGVSTRRVLCVLCASVWKQVLKRPPLERIVTDGCEKPNAFFAEAVLLPARKLYLFDPIRKRANNSDSASGLCKSPL